MTAIVKSYVIRIRHRDGGESWCLVYRPIYGASGRHIIFTFSLLNRMKRHRDWMAMADFVFFVALMKTSLLIYRENFFQFAVVRVEGILRISLNCAKGAQGFPIAHIL